MKAFNVIAKADEFKPNTWSEEDKLKWLGELEQTIYQDIVLTHDNPHNIEYNRTDRDSILIAPDRFSDMYIMWLLAKIDFNNGDITRYNNDNIVFNQQYVEFQNWWNRTYMPIQKATIHG